ncbi:MAG: aminoacyl-tRNA hydrolase [Gemmatimonadota bacterium]
MELPRTVKVICGLGNPGSEYHATRHNVGWWLLDLIHKEWHFERFRRVGNAHAAEGRLEDQPLRLIRPLTYMNRSGAALGALRQDPAFDFARDLLVIVDDAALPVGRARIRPSGSAGGHNGLKSIEAVLQTEDYARLRIGVGGAPEGEDLADWVLSDFEPDDEKRVVELLPKLVATTRAWALDGIDAAQKVLAT